MAATKDDRGSVAGKKDVAESDSEVQKEGFSLIKLLKGLPLVKLIIILAVIALVGGGGFVGWQVYSKGSTADAPKVSGIKQVLTQIVKKIKPGASEAPKAEAEKRVVFDWEPFLVNLADPGGRRYLKLSMKMELTSEAALGEMKARGFELQDIMLILLSSKEFEDISSPAGKIGLKQEMISQTNKLLKLGQVKEVYFTDFIVQ
ncbi:MAG: flagellar basal body-associated protein FliL [Syntrophobacteraceae bacterium]